MASQPKSIQILSNDISSIDGKRSFLSKQTNDRNFHSFTLVRLLLARGAVDAPNLKNWLPTMNHEGSIHECSRPDEALLKAHLWVATFACFA